LGSILSVLQYSKWSYRKRYDLQYYRNDTAINIKPFDYLSYLLKTLPNVDANDQSMLDLLLPWSDDYRSHEE
jgi:hypothetical protein